MSWSYYVPFDIYDEKGIAPLWYSPPHPQNLEPKSNHEKTSDQLKLTDILQNNQLLLFKYVKVPSYS